MDIAEIVVTAAGIALMVLTLWFFFGKKEKKQKASQAPYSCPMHPWITSNDPTANCSVCGMKLVRETATEQKG